MKALGMVNLGTYKLLGLVVGKRGRILSLSECVSRTGLSGNCFRDTTNVGVQPSGGYGAV